MNRMKIYSFDFFDDFYSINWQIAAGASSIKIVNKGYPDPGLSSVLLNDTSSSGRVVIRTMVAPECRDFNSKAPEDCELIVIGDRTTGTNVSIHCPYASGISNKDNYNMGFPVEFETHRIKIYFSIKGNPRVYINVYKGFSNNKLSFSISYVLPTYAYYGIESAPVVIGTGYAAVGEVYVDLVAFRQLHLTEEPQYRPLSKVYQHIPNGKGREVGVMSVGGVM